MEIKKGQGVGVSVATGEITNLAVTAAKLAADAVETAKIKDVNVTRGKLAADAIDSTKLADAAVAIEHVTQTNRAALKFIRANAGNTALEFSSAAPSASDNVTVEGITLTLGEWIEAGI